jgi:VRR-NUC domain
VKKEEAKLQAACIAWVRLQYPKILVWHCPNGGSRNAIEAANLKRQGVLAGVCDIHVDAARRGFHGLKAEAKSKNGKLSPAQKEYLKKCEAEGYATVVFNSFEQFIEIMNWYLG